MVDIYWSLLESEINNANEKIYLNMIRSRGSADGTLYTNPPNVDKIVVSEATDEELLAIPILGYKQGNLNKISGFTTKWDTVKIAVGETPTKYWIYKHPDANMNVGVSTISGITESVLNPSWLPSEE